MGEILSRNLSDPLITINSFVFGTATDSTIPTAFDSRFSVTSFIPCEISFADLDKAFIIFFVDMNSRDEMGNR